MTKLPSNFELDRYGLHVRLVREEDAEFIVGLRTNPNLSRFIHATDNDVEKQREWIHEYKHREIEGKDYYFIYEYEGIAIAVNRIYNRKEASAETGSWVVKPNTELALMFATLLIEREIYFEDLRYDADYFNVDKGNIQVWKLHQKMGAVVIAENDVEYRFVQRKDAFYKNREKFIRLLGLKK